MNPQLLGGGATPPLLPDTHLHYAARRPPVRCRKKQLSRAYPGGSAIQGISGRGEWSLSSWDNYPGYSGFAGAPTSVWPPLAS